MRAVERQYGLQEVDAWPIKALRLHCAVLRVPEGSDRAAVLAALSGDARIALAQPMHTFETRTGQYNDPYVGLQRGFQQMDVMGAHSWSTGEGIKVTIIDTGADTRHPDLNSSIAAADNFVDDDSEQFRRDRHGTEIAGIIAAIANNREGIVGIAPKSRLTIYKACWQLSPDLDAARCNSFTLARALAAAFDAHAQVVNLSLAGPADPLLSDLIREGLRRGVIIVGAAGDSERSGGGVFLDQPGVIEVASSSSRSTSPAALYAPGREILTSLPGGRYDFASGDSLATAEVSGVVALLLARKPGLSANAAYEILRDTSVHSNAAAGGEHVDACAAVVQLVGNGACVQAARDDAQPTTQNSRITAAH
jgi:subtilisin family serine protease